MSEFISFNEVIDSKSFLLKSLIGIINIYRRKDESIIISSLMNMIAAYLSSHWPTFMNFIINRCISIKYCLNR
jgi:hypothetical protein